MDDNYSKIFNEAAETLERERAEILPQEQRDELHVKLKPAIHRAMASFTEGRKRVFKLYEIYLVVLGTFLNGFGDYVVCQLKNCGT